MPETTDAYINEDELANHPANIYLFVKQQGNWFVEIASYLTRRAGKAYYELITGGSDMLNLLSHGNERITLKMDTDPFECNYILQQLPQKDGSYYMLKSISGRRLKMKLLLSDVILLLFGDLPKTVYIKCL